MRARAELSVDGGGGLARVVSDPPVTFRSTAEAVYVVGTAAGPLGDDDISMRVEVAAGGTLRLRSAAATVIYAGWGSRQSFDVVVGEGAHLDWHPEPLIATAGCHHHQQARVSLCAGARLDWTEEIVLGRHGEEPGTIDLRLDVEVQGRPLLRHQLAVGRPGWDGPAVLGSARAAGLRLVVGLDGWAPAALAGPGWAWLELQEPGWLLVAHGAELTQLRARMAAAQAFGAR